MGYRANVGKWWAGFDRFHDIREWKPGWSGDQRRWWWLYALNYGSRVLTGGPCVSWSRWSFERRKQLGSARLLTRLLNLVAADHGKNAGPILWDTEDTGAAVPTFILLLLAGLIVLLLVARWAFVLLVRVLG